MWDNQYVVWGGTKQLHIEKLGFVQIIPPNWGVSYHFWLARKSFSTTVSNDLSRANQIDMTGPNSVVLFAQTLVCSLCNYYKDTFTIQRLYKRTVERFLVWMKSLSDLWKLVFDYALYV